MGAQKSREQLQKELEEARRKIAELNKIVEKKNPSEDTAPKRSELSSRIMQFSPDPVFLINPDTSILFVNPAAEEITGYSLEELVGLKPPFPWWPEEEIEDNIQTFRRPVMETGHRIEKRFLTKEGREYWVEISTGPVMKDGELEYSLVRWVDITERKHIERIQNVLHKVTAAVAITHDLPSLLQQIREHLGTLIDTSTFYIALYDKDIKAYRFPFFVDPFDEAPDTPEKLEGSLTDSVRRERKSMLLHEEDIRAFYAERDADLYGTIPKVWLGVPLTTPNDVIGVLAVQSYDNRDAYTHDDLMMLDNIAGQLAVAIEKKRAEEALQESEERYRHLIEVSPTAICVHHEGKLVFANPAGLKLIGAERLEDVLGKAVLDFVVPEHRAGAAERMRAITELGESTPVIEEQFIRLDGEIVDVEVSGVPINYEGKPSAFLVIDNVSEKKRARQELQESEERFRQLADATFEAIVIHEGGIIREVNSSALEMFGYEREEIIGMNVVDLAAPESKELVGNMFRAGETKPYEAIGIRKDGSTFYSEIHGKNVSFRNRPVRVVAVQDITERKNAQERLLLQGAALEAAANAILIAESDGTISWVNPAFCKLTGFSSEEAIGQNPRIIKSGKQSNAFYEELWGTITSGKIWNGNLTNKRKDGSLYQEEMTITPIKDANGEISHFVAIKRDVTERMEAERHLAESEARNRSLIEANPDIIFVLDKNGVYLDVTAPSPDLLFVPEKELKGKRLEEVGLPDDLVERTLSAIERTLGTREMQSFEYELEMPVGKCYYEARLVPFGDDKVLSIVRDNTARIKAEAAVRESEQKYRTIIENSLEGISITQDQVLVFCNPRLAEMFGYKSPEEMIGKKVKDLVSPKSWDIVETEVRAREIGKKQVSHYTFIALKADGTEFEAETLGSRIFFEGKPAVQAVMRDISETKKLEAQLQQAMKMEAVGRLAGGVAHDFNNLLTAITGHAELIALSLKDNDPIKKDIEEIISVSDRAANLTRQLLAFSRKQAISPKVLDLNRIINDMDKMLKRVIGEDVVLETLQAKDLWKVKADPSQIEQIVVNLAVNSRDAMPDGGRLTIETANVTFSEDYLQDHPVSEPGSYVMLAVSDTGIGMSEEIKSHIFEPFFTSKEIGKGTGLGLATVYGIVKNAGGYVWVYSEEGKGTCFKIYLPRALGEEEVIEEVEKKPEVLGGSETILVIEDEETVRNVTVRTLKRFKYNVLEASSGQEAFELLERLNPTIDLVLTDVVMPGISGPKFIEKFRETNPGMKVLYMSGYTENAIVHQGVIDPNIPYIQKPFSPVGLAEKVRSLLNE